MGPPIGRVAAGRNLAAFIWLPAPASGAGAAVGGKPASATTTTTAAATAAATASAPFLVSGLVERLGFGVVEVFGQLTDQPAANESLQSAQIAVVVLTNEADGVPNGLGPAGASDPVYIVFHLRGKVQVDHV